MKMKKRKKNHKNNKLLKKKKMMKNCKMKLHIWNPEQNMKSKIILIFRKILSNPNSSVVWIEFVAYAAENEGIESARNVMERALRVINFNND
jgi:rRNA biogenesis protein RRP5